jgi:hypothetical protein
MFCRNSFQVLETWQVFQPTVDPLKFYPRTNYPTRPAHGLSLYTQNLTQAVWAGISGSLLPAYFLPIPWR